MPELLAYDFMRNALVAALLVGVAAPMVGIFLVQRRLSLIGDGIGHVALAGVAIGVLTGAAPVLTALAAAVCCAVAIELIRAWGRTSGDVALAVMFYGGIAAGVVLLSRSPEGSAGNLTQFLFGAITTTTTADVWVFAGLSTVVVGLTTVLRPWLFAVAHDEEYCRASGVPVTAVNVLLSVLTAVTVVVSMRVVGLLLISALMIVPNAAAQLLGTSFQACVRIAVAIGVLSGTGGVVLSYYAATPSGGTIVLLTIVAFLGASAWTAARTMLRRRRHREAERHEHEHGPYCGHEAVAHDDHVDYVHDGHRHAPHQGHYDEHAGDANDGPGHVDRQRGSQQGAPQHGESASPHGESAPPHGESASPHGESAVTTRAPR